MRMNYRKEELQAFLRGKLLPGKVSPSLRARHPWVLQSLRPLRNPEWFLTLRASHRRTAVFDWIVAKKVLSHVPSWGEKVTGCLCISTDWETTLLKTLQLLELKISRSLRSRLSSLPHSILDQAKRIFLGYCPSILLASDWNPVRVAETSRIGVGYKDRGTLGSGLSWKDQILPVEDIASQPRSFAYQVHLSLG